MPESVASDSPSRRDFFKRSTAVALGVLAVVAPVTAGIAVLLDPLRRHGQDNGAFLRVATLAAVPQDGLPRKFTVSSSRTDAWNKFPNMPVGAVYLRRAGPDSIDAFNAICPHAGGFIDYMPDAKCYLCPLHNSRFALDGSIQSADSPSPRPMDSLAVEIRGDEIWVQFQNFQAGVRRKTPA
jgi:menaquinol-cytochrome c reductase iron-sulfur subunit